jgi:hypothetical protein
MQHAELVWAVVNATSSAVLVGVTIWYAYITARMLDESRKATGAAERQATAAEESIRALRLQIEEQSGLAKSIVATAIQSTIRNIEYWRNVNTFNLAAIKALPETIELVPTDASRAVEHARRISADASAQLASCFDNLRHARLDLEIMRSGSRLTPYQLQQLGNRVGQHFEAAGLDVNEAQRLLQQSIEERGLSTPSKAT